MSWRKRMKWRLDWLTNDHLELSYCTICWATVWMPHKELHQQWHETAGHDPDSPPIPGET